MTDEPREEFLRRLVAVMAGISAKGETLEMAPKVFDTEFSDEDRALGLVIMDEYIESLQRLKELCLRLQQARDRSKEMNGDTK